MKRIEIWYDEKSNKIFGIDPLTGAETKIVVDLPDTNYYGVCRVLKDPEPQDIVSEE